MRKIVFILAFIAISGHLLAQSFANYGANVSISQGTVLNSEINFTNETSGNIYVTGLLKVSGTLTNNGEINISNGGSLIDNGSISGTGDFIVDLDISSEYAHYVSSPISNALVNVFAGAYVDRFDESASEWIALTQSDVLSNMQGYSVRCLQDAVFSFTGSVNTGSRSITLGMQESGWNLVGNPYPSAIDWDASGWTKMNIDNSIYFWTGTNYATYNGTTGYGTNNATQYIPAMQGYFVRCNSLSGVLASDNQVRLYNNQEFFKSSEKPGLEKIKLKATANGLSDETFIFFSDNASDNLESDYDAVKLFSSNMEVPQLYTLTAANHELAINTLHLLNEDISIPLGFICGKAGVYSISLTELDLENEYPVFITDLKSNQTVDLSQKSTYSFSYNTHDSAERFVIHFKNSANAINEMNLENINIYAKDNTIVIDGYSYIPDNSSVKVYNYLGKIVSNQKLNTNQTYITINKASGVYLVKVFSGNHTITRKVLISN